MEVARVKGIFWGVLCLVLVGRVECRVEVEALMEMKAAMDPTGTVLRTWVADGDPCSDTVFEGVACNEWGKVANVSLQSKGLSGVLSPAVAKLRCLNGLYLHYNKLRGEIPKGISNLTELVDLYINVNMLNGTIPPELGSMSSLQALQLCCNRLNGSIPEELGNLKKLTMLSMHNNQLTGSIPSSLGKLSALTRLDISSNYLSGEIPQALVNLKQLTDLDLHNNSLSGSVPQELKDLKLFQYNNNLELCGYNLSSLPRCNVSNPSDAAKPMGTGTVNVTSDPVAVPKITEPPNLASSCQNCSSSSSPGTKIGIVSAIVAVVFVAIVAVASLAFALYRRRKQKISSAFETSDGRHSADQLYHYKDDFSRKCSSPLVLLEYSSDWDPLEDGGTGMGCFRFNLDEIEQATNYFSDKNLLGRNGFSSVFKGVLRDGSAVVVKCISKASCKTHDIEFQEGLKTFMQIRHENVAKLRGFCCSKARAECFLVYEYLDNRTLLHNLDSESCGGLAWPTRVRIACDVAKAIEYLHEGLPEPIVHQNISAANILLDQENKPYLSDCALHRILADDIVYSLLKSSAAMGYLAPEYATVGRLTLKSDVFAFGKVIFQLLTGITKNNNSSLPHSTIKSLVEFSKVEDFIDPSLNGQFSVVQAMNLAKIALACTNEVADQRPSMSTVLHRFESEINQEMLGIC
ncbi:hypothetical protein SUGI_1166800 [Cryptomeria japonica]|uniref:LRR receptor-like serine/threonine-protein kinase GSO2 n=1 Tax=Cryptomeria japonica TaxID=3369 RepID=UPI0024148595|nr:LRR receptor-like serine/threonine-protein kinase GSO2 [Cryptomeria japonica]GLJ54351.1 hypothetical protein SUGI_1166800 [Cryptomeria japonica]